MKFSPNKWVHPIMSKNYIKINKWTQKTKNNNFWTMMEWSWLPWGFIYFVFLFFLTHRSMSWHGLLSSLILILSYSIISHNVLSSKTPQLLIGSKNVGFVVEEKGRVVIKLLLFHPRCWISSSWNQRGSALLEMVSGQGSKWCAAVPLLFDSGSYFWWVRGTWTSATWAQNDLISVT